MLEEATDKYLVRQSELVQLAKDIRAKIATYDHQKLQTMDDDRLLTICDRAVNLRSLLDIVKDRLPERRDQRPQRETDVSPLEGGGILLKIDDPISFICDVIRQFPNPTFRQSVATILSLWNAQTSIGLSKRSE